MNICFFNTKGQPIFRPSTTAECQYPYAGAATAYQYHLYPAATDQVSNFAMRINNGGVIKEWAACGWSADGKGGFSLLDRPALPSPTLFKGRYADTLTDVRDIQVALMEYNMHPYLVVAYYDKAVSNYAFRLYSCSSITAPTLLYTYHFRDPHNPNMPYSINATMGYNRISVDVSATKEEIAFVFTDGDNDNMYTAVGKLQPAAGHDSIFFSPNVPQNTYSFASLSSSIGVMCITALDTMLCDTIGVPAPCTWPAGYDTTVFKCDPILGMIVDVPYNPLIRLRAASTMVFGPPGSYAPEYQQLWPDVAFYGSNITYSFYCPAKKDSLPSTDYENIYLMKEIAFGSLYNYNGATAMDHYCEYFDYAKNTEAGGAEIYDGAADPLIFPIGFTGYKSNFPIPYIPGEDFKYNLDAPDASSAGATWAVAYATLDHVIVRYNQALINQEADINGAATSYNYDLTGVKNTDVDLAFNADGSRIHLAWVVDAYPALPGISASNPKGIIGVEIDPFTATPPSPLTFGGDASLVSLLNYLNLPYYPNNSFGDFPTLALSKHSYDLNGLYTCFGQYQKSGGIDVYAIQHKNHIWTPVSDPSTWRRTDPSQSSALDAGAAPLSRLQVAPNPFSERLVFRSDNPTYRYSITLSDMTGRVLIARQGTVQELSGLSAWSSLAAALYMLRYTDPQGNTHSQLLQKK